MRRAAGWEQEFFDGRVAAGSSTDELPSGSFTTEATVKVHVDGERVVTHRRGQRPGQRPRRRRCAPPSRRATPQLDRVHLTDFKVRVLDTAGTGAVTRVLIDSTDGERTWIHHRRQREHHRGVVAGPVRLDRLRPAAHVDWRWPRPSTSPSRSPIGRAAVRVARPRARRLDRRPPWRPRCPPPARRPLPRRHRSRPGLRARRSRSASMTGSSSSSTSMRKT